MQPKKVVWSTCAKPGFPGAFHILHRMGFCKFCKDISGNLANPIINPIPIFPELGGTSIHAVQSHSQGSFCWAWDAFPMVTWGTQTSKWRYPKLCKRSNICRQRPRVSRSNGRLTKLLSEMDVPQLPHIETKLTEPRFWLGGSWWWVWLGERYY